MDRNANLYQPASRINKHIRISIFEEITMLSLQNQSKNLAQGFPDWETPEFVREYLTQAISKNENQYIRVGGHPKLVQEIAKTYGPKINRTLDPLTEVTVANGATGILNNALASFVEEGDEVIVFEPVFEFYFAQAEIYGGKVKYFSLNEPTADSDSWTIDFEKLESYFTEKTRIILLNTPHNPTGKILKREDLERIYKILEKFPRVIVLADEVYEHNVFNGNEHLRIASVPGYWERTISIYSGGKIFSCTGWRVGWGIGPAHLIKPMTATQNWTHFCLSRPTMVSFADSLEYSLDKPYQGKANYYEWLSDLYAKKKDELVKILRNAPFDYRVLDPDGGYFVIVDITNTIPKIPKKYFYKVDTQENEPVGDVKALKDPEFSPDYAFTRWLTTEYGVTPVPMFAFYNQADAKSKIDYKGGHLVRFAVCKSDETLGAVAEKLKKH